VFIYMRQMFPNKTFWVNDLYFDLYQFWINAKERNEELVAAVKEMKTRFDDGKKMFEHLVDNRAFFSDFELAVAFFALNRSTFSGTSLSGGYSQESFDKRFTESSIERLSEVSSVLGDNVRITNEDFSVLLDAPGEDVFIFLDPPYYSAEKSALYGKNGDLHKGFDHQRFADCCRRCKHKWLITYDDSPYIRDLFKDYHIEELKFNYGMNNVVKDSSMLGHEIIITNYDGTNRKETELF